MIDTLVALALLGTAGVAFLTGLAVLSKSTIVTREQATADSLVRAQVEYVKDSPYQQSAATYPVNPLINIPTGWQVPPPSVQPVHATDDGLQEVTVSAQRAGRTILTMTVYKMDR